MISWSLSLLCKNELTALPTFSGCLWKERNIIRIELLDCRLLKNKTVFYHLFYQDSFLNYQIIGL